MTKPETLRKLLKSFETLQKDLSRFGAWDTEPDYIFHALVVDVLNQSLLGKEFIQVIPSDALGWALYTDKPGVERTAKQLHDAMQEIVTFVQLNTYSNPKDFREIIAEVCHRAAWNIISCN